MCSRVQSGETMQGGKNKASRDPKRGGGLAPLAYHVTPRHSCLLGARWTPPSPCPAWAQAQAFGRAWGPRSLEAYPRARGSGHF